MLLYISQDLVLIPENIILKANVGNNGADRFGSYCTLKLLFPRVTVLPQV
jgi:hypothetical protein